MFECKNINQNKTGNAVVTFTSEDVNLSMGFESVTQQDAVVVMSALSCVSLKNTSVIVKDGSVVDNKDNTNLSDGGDNMETRLAVLETEVAHIKNDVSDLKSKASSIEATVNSVDKNIAVILEKLDGIKDSVSKKPSTDAVEKRISEAKLAIILSVPAIIAVGTAIYKGVMFLYNRS